MLKNQLLGVLLLILDLLWRMLNIFRAKTRKFNAYLGFSENISYEKKTFFVLLVIFSLQPRFYVQCPECKRLYANGEGLKQHQRRMHKHHSENFTDSHLPKKVRNIYVCSHFRGFPPKVFFVFSMQVYLFINHKGHIGIFLKHYDSRS